MLERANALKFNRPVMLREDGVDWPEGSAEEWPGPRMATPVTDSEQTGRPRALSQVGSLEGGGTMEWSGSCERSIQMTVMFSPNRSLVSSSRAPWRASCLVWRVAT